MASVLFQKFEEICSSNGDDTCFYVSEYDRLETNTNEIQNVIPPLRNYGFSELNENISTIASEMYFRHSIQPQTYETSSSSPLPCKEVIKKICSQCVLIVSDQVSCGEAAAVLACVRLKTVFVPIALEGNHKTSEHRLHEILGEIKPVAAIAVLATPEPTYDDEGEDDWENKPALSSNEADLDSHPTVKKLNQLGIHRVICISAFDGKVFSPMTGFEKSSLPDIIDGEIDPMYILYTSGSSSKPKAVVQTYKGLLNRIQWQWDTFPFVQQMRRDIGYNETIELLRTDGMITGERDLENINDIVLRRTSLSFVDSMAEIFATLLGGASLFCPLILDGIDYDASRQGMGVQSLLSLAQRDNVKISRMTLLPTQLEQAFRSNSSLENNEEWLDSIDTIVVSGEPCPLRLGTLFQNRMKRKKAVLVNLYGQSETSADVSCLVVTTKDGESKFARFPKALKYYWNKEMQKNTSDRFIDNCIKSLTPCGYPIHGHEFVLENEEPFQMSRLFVKGKGVALCYANNFSEMQENFNISTCNDGQSEILFNTLDLVFKDGEGMIYVVGRAPRDKSDRQDGICSLSMGKINGVRVHSAEIEVALELALTDIFTTKNICTKVHPSDVAAFLATIDGKTESVAVIDGSGLFSKSYIDKFETRMGEAVLLDATTVNIGSLPFSKIITEIRSTMQSRVHPSIIPNHIFLVDKFPTNGAAMKNSKISLLNTVKLTLDSCRKENGCAKSLESLRETILSIFASGLAIDRNKIEFFLDSSFVDLGGDSMKAISIYDRIMLACKHRNLIPTDNTISTADIMQLSIEEVLQILQSGRNSQPPLKKSRVQSPELKLDLASLGGFSMMSTNNDDKTCSLLKVWEVPMLMCVDSCPVVIKFGIKMIIVCASQGGDIACIDAHENLVLNRSLVRGKVEGDLSFFKPQSHKSRALVFVPSYDSTSQNSKGCIHSFFLDEKGMTQAWVHDNDGEIKNKVVPFQFEDNESCVRLVSGSFDGYLSYINADTGKVLCRRNDLGGAIKADPCLLPQKSTNEQKVLVASCSWKGSVTCVSFSADSFKYLWSVDLWTAIYSAPEIFSGTNIAATCGIDGNVRGLDVNSGEIKWCTKTIAARPIFSKCRQSGRYIVFGSHDGSFRCIDTNGIIQWQIEVNSPILSSALVTSNEKLVFADISGKVHVIGVNGEPLGSPFLFEAEIFGSPRQMHDNQILIGCRDSKLHLLRITDEI